MPDAFNAVSRSQHLLLPETQRQGTFMRIGHYSFGPHQRPYLIAEMSGNHNQSLERALAIVDAAAAHGADAIKLQTYTADTMTLDVRKLGFVIEDAGSLWAGRQLYELYDQARTLWDWHKSIMARAASHALLQQPV